MRHILFFALLLAPGQIRAQETKQSPDERIKALEERLNKIEGAPAKTSLSAFNPAMGMALDFVQSATNGKGNFNFRAAEINLEAPIDPFAKGWAIVTGSQGGVEVEEAALETTSLPYNLTVRGGRLFAPFGRLAHFHDHELPVVNRPRSLDTYIGGETQADGLEASYLLPTDLFVNLTLGAYNKMGGENTRADNAVARSYDQFTYLGRLSTYADLGDNHSLELGLDSAWTPKRFVLDNSADADGDGVPDSSAGLEQRMNTWRALSGVDLTYRYQPASGGIYKGVVWGTEVMVNNERRFDPSTRLPTDRVKSFAGFSYIQVKLGRRWKPAVMVDLTEDQDNPHQLTSTYTASLSYDVTEFQRLRVNYEERLVNTPGVPKQAHTVALQWSAVLGHHVHGFRDR